MASLFYTAPTVTNETFDVKVGQQLDEVEISSGAEGSAITRLWGRNRIAGKLIWATNFREEATEVVVGSTTTSGGKGGGGGSSQTTYQTQTSYSYFCSFAFGLCEGGEGVQMGRIWIDGKLIEQGLYTIRFYPGNETQQPDPWIEAVEGTGQVPAFRGTAYVVFEDFPLAEFGNRIPVVTVEVIKPLDNLTDDDLEKALQGVCMIPASGEMSYATSIHFQDDGYGNAATVNMHNGTGDADAKVSLDQLEAQSENVDSVLLVIAWFGDDLRAGECQIKPKVEFKPVDDYTTAASWTHDLVLRAGQTIRFTNQGGATTVTLNKPFEDGVSVVTSIPLGSGESVEYTVVDSGNYFTQGATQSASFTVTLIQNNRVYPTDWFVNGLDRLTADEVTRLASGDLAYGGTPSDHTVVEYIQELKSRGIRVIFYPFIMMDQDVGNGLPDPYGGAEQSALPWRGRITCHPAAGQPGTVDQTATAATQINDWFGTAQQSDFGTDSAGYPIWNGADPDEWGYRRMVLHYANLCELAGGVDGFIVGTELRGITGVRSGATGPFPGVVNMEQLATDVKAVVSGTTKVGYAADWSEYHSYRPDDGTGDVFFNMDDLWSSASIDFIGIDNYLPLSDYRDGDTDSIYDLDYLMSHVEGGEYYDYFYASQSDRDNNVRTPITDGAHSKPWVFRQKDIKNWWLNSHVNRPGGTETGGNTSWVPQSKPIWFTEYGCPAVDKGPNQPNVFFDPKSSESALPHFSNGKRDDLVQRRYAEAFLKYWRPSTGNNPSSTQYSGNMVDFDNTFAWTWDARPFPQFPYLTSTWTDATNYRKGHWLNGRLGVVPLALLVKEICIDYGIAEEDIDVSGLFGADSVVRGFFEKDINSGRELLTALMEAYMFDGFESEGKLKFILRQNFVEVDLDEGQLVNKKNDPGGFSLTRSQETELPETVQISFIDEENDYQISAVEGSKQVGSSKDLLDFDLPLVLESGYAKSITDATLQQAWMQRERAEFTLPSSLMRIDPSDVINITLNGNPISVSVTKIDSGDVRDLEAQAYDRTVYDTLEYVNSAGTTQTNTVFGFSLVEFMDIPLLTGEEPSPHAPRVAAYQSPWPGAVNVFKDNNAGGYTLNVQVPFAAPMGELVAEFYSGPSGIWDVNNDLYVQLYSSDQLLSTTDAAVLEGANAIAIKNLDGEWEILQFVNADLLAPGKYKLSRLLRGQLGSEHAMRDPIPAGARCVVLNASTLGVIDMNLNSRLTDINYRYGPAAYQQDDFRFTNETFNAKGVGLRPYSPVHLKAVRDYSNDDVTLSWIRRTRFGGDSWNTAEVPLNEDFERYDIEIMDGSTVVRTVTVDDVSSWLYTAANQTADFGSVQPTVTFKVYQISAIYGRGIAGTATVTL